MGHPDAGPRALCVTTCETVIDTVLCETVTCTHRICVTVPASKSVVGAIECETVSRDVRGVFSVSLFPYPGPLCDWGV